MGSRPYILPTRRYAATVTQARDDVSLEVRSGGVVVFTSSGKWLHPLLELEEYLDSRDLDRSGLSLRDKVIGKAAALLIVRLGIRDVHAGLLSRGGAEALLRHGVRVSCDELVERIACQTEDLLAGVTDPEEAHVLVVSRARLARERARRDGVAS
jgi:hypothetical protein